jgi:hypothetical protein
VLAVAALLSWLGWRVVPAGPVPVPAADGAASVLWPLVPVVAAVGTLSVLGVPGRDLERTASMSGSRLRALVLACCLGATAVAVLPAIRFDLAVGARNAVALTGLAVAGATVLPAATAWLPVTVVPMTMWLLGTDTASRRTEQWAFLLAPAGSRPAWWAAAVLGVVAGASYLLSPWFTSGWSPRARRRRRRSAGDPRTGRPRPPRRPTRNPWPPSR